MSHPFHKIFAQAVTTEALTEKGEGTTNDAALLESFYLECVSRNLRTKTIAGYAERLRWLLDLAHDQAKSLGDVTREDIRDYIVACLRRDPPLSPISINGRLAVWRIFYNYCTDEYRHAGEPLLIGNPLSNIRLLKVDRKDPDWLRPEQVNQILRLFDVRRASDQTSAYIHARNRNLTLLLYDTMIRPGEACRLTFDDIDLKAKTGGLLKIRQTKSRYPRQVPLHADVARSLHTFYHRYRVQLPGQTFFCYADGRPMTIDRLSRMYYNVGKRLGYRVTPYMFRHGGATGYIMRGGAIEVLQDVMGHTDIRITRRYVHPGAEFAQTQHPQFSAHNLLREA